MGIFIFITLIFPSNSFSLNSRTLKDSGSFSIASFSPTLTNDIRGEIEINTDSQIGTHLKVSLLKPTNTRSELFGFADKPSSKQSPVAIVDLPLSDFTLTQSGSKLGSFSINASTIDSLSIPKTGIYPVAIQLQDGQNNTLSTQFSYTTFISGATKDSQAYAEKLNVVPILSYNQNVEEEKLFTYKDTLTDYGKKVKNEFDTLKSTLDALLAIDTPKTFSINGQYLNTNSIINDSINGANTPLIDIPSSATTQYVAATYVPLNIVELRSIGEDQLFSSALSKSRTALANSQISAPSRTLITKSVSKQTIETILGSGIDKLIVDEKTFPKEKLGLKPTKLSSQDGSITLATYNSDFLNHVNLKNSISTQANFLDAYSSVVALEAPSNQRALIMPLDISLLNPTAIETYLLSMKMHPLLTTMTTDVMFNTISPNTNISTRLEKSDYGFTNKNMAKKDEVQEAQQYLSSIKSLYQTDSLEAKLAIDLFYNTLEVKDPDSSPENKNDKLKNLAFSAASYISLPTKRTITLTSKENSIPVTIKNSSNKAITVAVNLKSDKLVFTKSHKFEVTLNGQNTTLQVPVKTRTSGSFPIEITMTSVDGKILLASQTVTLRSTSFSGVGVTIMIGSFLFLLIWWATHARKNRKKIPGDVIELRKEKMA